MSQLTADPAEISRMALRVMELKLEHRDLDIAIARLQASMDHEELSVRRMKKSKLQLKDAIERLESAFIPDLDA